MSQETVTSVDGTPIATWRSGEGPPLVLVHGTAADHSRWAPVLPAFEQHFTVNAVDRRGRGGSGDAEDYAVDREFEDVAAVVDSVGESAILLGHSYGALCALEAARLTRNVGKLVLYEPGIEVAGEQIYPPAVIERLEALPDSRIVVMPGHGHAAMDTATELFKSEVLRFVSGAPTQHGG